MLLISIAVWAVLFSVLGFFLWKEVGSYKEVHKHIQAKKLCLNNLVVESEPSFGSGTALNTQGRSAVISQRRPQAGKASRLLG